MIALAARLTAALLPAALFAALLWDTRRRPLHREPIGWLVATFTLGGGAAALAGYAVARARTLIESGAATAAPHGSDALVLAFLVVAPLQEVGTFGAVWPALATRRFERPFDGVAFATASALGFAAVEDAQILIAHSSGAVWIARVLLALPAHVFCASLWGYALARSPARRRGVSLFPAAFAAATLAHGLYVYFVYGRGPGALVAVAPLLSAMGLVAWLLGRGLMSRTEAGGPPSGRRAGLALFSQPPSLDQVRDAMRAGQEPVRVSWIFLGAIVTFGAMLLGLLAGALATHALHIDLSTVSESDARSAAPVLLVGAPPLASFPVSGWLIARAAGVHTLLEPALAALLGLVLSVGALGVVSPSSLIFALAISPIAWLLSCFGAWAGSA